MKIQNVLQIGDTDLHGNKFNGHDLHKYLRMKGIESVHMVVRKESDDSTTVEIESQCKKRIPDEILSSDDFWQTDLVHLHLIHNNVLDVSALPLLSQIRPLVWTLHDPWCVSGGCIYHFDCEKWQSHCHDCAYLKMPFESKYDDRAINFLIKERAIQAAEISGIVASKWMENMVAKSPIWKGKEIYHVPFGVNQDVFCLPKCPEKIRKALGIHPDNVVMLLRATQSKYKGLEIIKEALSFINERNITILTVDQTGLLEEFNEKYQIIDFGWIDDTKLKDLYQVADVFLMPSEQEAFGMMAVEAMSCGCCPVVIEGTSLPEVVNAPEHGIVTTKQDFAKTLYRLVKSKECLKSRGLKCYEYAQKEYNKEIYISRLIRCYEDIVSRWKVRRGGIFVSRTDIEPWIVRHRSSRSAHSKKMLKYIYYDFGARVLGNARFKQKRDKYRISILQDLL